MRRSSAHNIIQQILDLLFPPSERIKQIRSLTSSDMSRLNGEKSPEKAFIEAVCDYEDESVQNVVHAAKYDASMTAIELMAEIMAETLPAICEEQRIFADKIVITSIPLSVKRQQKRGFNQSHRLAKMVEKNDATNTFECQAMLKKVKKTPDQTRLSRQERKDNLVGAFQVRPNTEIPEDIIIVIDDVTTTGATLAEARRALKKQTTARIVGVAFAH